MYTVSNYSLSSDERSNRVVAITFKVKSSDPNKDENRKIYPYRSFYGYATFLNGSYVMSECQLQFQEQVIYYWESSEQQLASEIYEQTYAMTASIKTHFDVLAPNVKIGGLTLETPVARQCIACPINNFFVSVMPDVTYDVKVQYEPVDAGDLSTIQYRILRLN